MELSENRASCPQLSWKFYFQNFKTRPPSILGVPPWLWKPPSIINWIPLRIPRSWKWNWATPMTVETLKANGLRSRVGARRGVGPMELEISPRNIWTWPPKLGIQPTKGTFSKKKIEVTHKHRDWPGKNMDLASQNAAFAHKIAKYLDFTRQTKNARTSG